MSSASSQTVTDVRWSDAFSWWIIFRAAGRSFSPTIILLASLGTLGTWAGLSLADRIGLAGHNPALIVIAGDSVPDAGVFGLRPSQRAMPGVAALGMKLPGFLSDGVRLVSIPFSPTATAREMASAFARIGWVVLVWSIFGTAITRAVSLQLAGEESPGLFGSLGFGMGFWMSSFNSVIFVLLGMFALSIPGALLGIAMRTDIGLMLVGILWPVVLAGSLVLSILAIGVIVGWPLMVATVAVERGDSFQAISSSFSYLYQRPLHLFFYGTVALVVALPALVAVALFGDVTTSLAMWAASWGMGHDRTVEILTNLESTKGSLGMDLLLFWRQCIDGILQSFGVGYFWAVVTAFYLLLRRDVDGTELDEVVLEEASSATSA